MKLSKIMIFALSSALLLSGCAKEEIAGGGMADEKNVIRFTLGGAVAVTKSTVTRANGDNDQKTETERIARKRQKIHETENRKSAHP